MIRSEQEEVAWERKAKEEDSDEGQERSDSKGKIMPFRYSAGYCHYESSCNQLPDQGISVQKLSSCDYHLALCIKGEVLRILPSRRIVAISPYVTPPTKYTTTAGRGCDWHCLLNSGIMVSPGSIFRPFWIMRHPFLTAFSTSRALNQEGSYTTGM